VDWAGAFSEHYQAPGEELASRHAATPRRGLAWAEWRAQLDWAAAYLVRCQAAYLVRCQVPLVKEQVEMHQRFAHCQALLRALASGP